jgi:Flp pilus assembly protein TadG
MISIKRNPKSVGPRRGVSLIWATCSITLLGAFVSLSVDFGRVQSAKADLQMIADASARAAASQLGGTSSNATSARAQATAIASANHVDGQAFQLGAANIVFGRFENNAFTALPDSDFSRADAVRVTARTETFPLYFGRLIGRQTLDIESSSVATIPTGATVDGQDYLWLAGMPNNASMFDRTASQHAPQYLKVTPGQTIRLQVTGTEWDIAYWVYWGMTNIDGEGSRGKSNWYANGHNQISGVTAPMGSLLGVFAGENPVASSVQAWNAGSNSPLDFSTNGKRNFKTLTPAANQTFFIGDGKRVNGELQEFVVPPGCTRLYLGMNDGEWWYSDNVGTINVSLAGNGTTGSSASIVTAR